MEMTPEILVKACRDNNGYKQPRLNNQLFLQCRGFCEIANLAPYTELKALWLDQNAIQEMEGLEQLTQLCSLFLQNNAIRRIQGLDNLVNLRTLNLSHNHLAKLSDLRNCPQLETLQVSHNRIERLEDVEEIFLLPKLSCLDLSHNRIDERPADAGDAFLVEFFGRCKELAVLYLHGQDIARKFRNYRKTMVAGLPELTYLDERPVFPQERRAAVAWSEGGADAEMAVMNKIREEREHELTACIRYQQSLNTEENKAKRAAREAVLAEREAAEKEWRSQLRIETTRKCTAADHDEYEARAHLELEYEAACNALSNLAVELRATALALEAQRVAAEKVEAERRAVEAAARAEIEAKERRDLEELQRERAKRQEAFDEMRFWVRKWAREDAADEQELQGQLDALLAELEPPAPHAMPSTGSPSAEDSAMETASDTADSATNESSASSAPKQFKSKKLRRWAASASKFEQMFQAEKAAARPAAS